MEKIAPQFGAVEVDAMADVLKGPFVVEIPMKNLWPSKQIEQGGREGTAEPGATKITERNDALERMCAARSANGTPCPMKADRGKTMCARHERWYRSIPVMMGMPYPEDAVGLQDVLAQVVVMVLNRELDVERAKVVAQLCQVMQKNLRDYRREVLQADREEQRWSRVQ